MKRIIFAWLLLLYSLNSLQAEIINQNVQFSLESIKQEVEASRRRRFESSVRNNNAVCARELNMVANRLPKVHNAMQKLTGMSFEVKETPFVSLVCSGGGYRAMIATAGVLA